MIHNTSTWTTVTYRRRSAKTGEQEGSWVVSFFRDADTKQDRPHGEYEGNLLTYETSYEGSFTKDKRYRNHCSASGYKRRGNHSTKTASYGPTRDRTGRRLYMKKGERKANAAR